MTTPPPAAPPRWRRRLADWVTSGHYTATLTAADAARFELSVAHEELAAADRELTGRPDHRARIALGAILTEPGVRNVLPAARYTYWRAIYDGLTPTPTGDPHPDAGRDEQATATASEEAAA